MNIFLTLDYEPYLLNPGDEIKFSLIDPTYRFCQILNIYNFKSIIFVDAGFLFALHRQRYQFLKLNTDFLLIQSQLHFLVKQGHEIGLHIHPHWEDCYYDGVKWRMNLKRYKFSDFSKDESHEIFIKYHKLLSSLISSTIISYRAGGWCIEPFSHIKDAIIESKILIDSSVFYGGYLNNKTHFYDFRNYPSKDIWNFEMDPSIECINGSLLEIPFSTYTLSPSLYWNILYNKIFKNNNKIAKGYGVQPNITEVFNKLLFSNVHAVSMDSFKSNLLIPTFYEKKNIGNNIFCVIGHPKCFTELTYLNLNRLLEISILSGDSILTFSKFLNNFNI